MDVKPVDEKRVLMLKTVKSNLGKLIAEEVNSAYLLTFKIRNYDNIFNL